MDIDKVRNNRQRDCNAVERGLRGIFEREKVCVREERENQRREREKRERGER